MLSQARVLTFPSPLDLPLHFVYTSLVAFVGQVELCFVVHSFVFLFEDLCQPELLKARNMSSFILVSRLGERRKHEFYSLTKTGFKFHLLLSELSFPYREHLPHGGGLGRRQAKTFGTEKTAHRMGEKSV